MNFLILWFYSIAIAICIWQVIEMLLDFKTLKILGLIPINISKVRRLTTTENKERRQ